MSFQCSALSAADFADLFALDDQTLAQRNIRRQTVDRNPGYPCRVSLQDAEVGEEVLLLPFTHQPAATPYRSGGAIFVRRGAATAQPLPGEVPHFLLHRNLSVRGYDREGMMTVAHTVAGSDLATLIEQLATHPRVAYLHLHNAGPGCYNCRVDYPGKEVGA